MASITAQKRTNSSLDSGFSFQNCTVTGSGKVYLGRAWGDYSRVVFSYTYMDNLVLPKGWSDWGDQKRDSLVQCTTLKSYIFFVQITQGKGLILCLYVCVAGGYIMENTCVVDQELTWLEECHGHGCSRMKRPSLLLGPNSLKGTLGSLAPKHGETERTCRLQNHVMPVSEFSQFMLDKFSNNRLFPLL